MRCCGTLLTTCSNSGLLGSTLLPAVLGVVDSQLAALTHLPAVQHSLDSLCGSQSLMAQSALMSPVKARPFCCNSGTSPALSPVRTCSPRSPARAHKRCLSAVQHCLAEGSEDIASLPHSLHHQQHGPGPLLPPLPAAAAADDFTVPCHAAKRQEVAQGSTSKPCQPVTPAVVQPEPLAAGLGPSCAGVTPTPTAADAAGSSPEAFSLPHLCSSSSSGDLASTPVLAANNAAAAAAAGSVLEQPSNHVLSALPPPTVVLDRPPSLVVSAAAQQRKTQVSSSQAGAHMQQHRQHQPHFVMSGHQVAEIHDIPVDLNFLDKYPHRKPDLGSGRLEVFMGPMFAGKTTALLNRVQELLPSAPALLGVKSIKDKRYGLHWILAHGGKALRCARAASLAEFKANLGSRWHKLQVIAIDEGQFFPDLVEFCQEAVDHDGKHVIVAGLSGDFRRRRFGQVLDLLPLADKVHMLTSICSVCGGKALFSLRRVQSGPQEVVGGDEVYQATCRRCYLEHGGDVE